RHVARAGRRAAGRPGVACRVLAAHVRPVTLIERARIAVGGARGPTRLLGGVGQAVGPGSRTVLGQVAFAHRCAADRARGDEAVGGATPARPGAALGDVADPGRRTAHRAAGHQGARRGAARRARAIGGALVALLARVRVDLAVTADGDLADVDERAPTLGRGARDRVVGAVARVVVVVVPAETRPDGQEPVAVVVLADETDG